MSGVYIIRNTQTGRAYVGASFTSVWTRMSVHRRDLELGRHRIRGFQSDWNRFGPDAFEWVVVKNARLGDDLREMESAEIERQRTSAGGLYNRMLTSGIRLDPSTTARLLEIDCKACGSPFMTKVQIEGAEPFIRQVYCSGIKYPRCVPYKAERAAYQKRRRQASREAASE